MKNFSIILPTRNRPAMLNRFFNGLIETTRDLASLEVVICFDEDDSESLKVSHPSLSIVKLVLPRGKNMGDFIRACYENSKGRYLILMNDDVVFASPGWDSRVESAFSGFSDDTALVYGNDLYYGSRLATFPILSRSACELMGGLHLPPYKSHSIDSHIFDIFERLSQKGHKRYVYLADVIFEHMNYGVSAVTYDANLSKINHHEDDRALYMSLAAERQRIADKMARYLEDRAKKASKMPNPGISVIMQVNPGGERDAVVCIKDIYRDNNPANSDLEILIILPAGLHLSVPKEVRGKVRILHDDGKNTVRAFNKGAAAAKGEYLIFLKGGVFFERGWISALAKAASNDASGIIGSRWLNPRNGRVEHVGISFFDDNGVMAETCMYKGFPPEHPAVNRRREFQAVRINGALVKKDIFIKVKGFDENIDGRGDVDFCLKARELGKTIICLPEATIYYREERVVAGHDGRAACDLEKFLSEDGFSLRVRDDERYIAPLALAAKEPVKTASFGG